MPPGHLANAVNADELNLTLPCRRSSGRYNAYKPCEVSAGPLYMNCLHSHQGTPQCSLTRAVVKLPLKSLKSERPASASKLSEAEAGSEFTSSGTWTLAGTGCKKTSAPTRRSSPSQQHRLKNRVKMLALSGTHHTLQKRPAAVIDSCWAFQDHNRPCKQCCLRLQNWLPFRACLFCNSCLARSSSCTSRICVAGDIGGAKFTSSQGYKKSYDEACGNYCSDDTPKTG